MTTTEAPTGEYRYATADRTANVRIHLRGGQIIETRCENVTTQRDRVSGDLVGLRLEGEDSDWPSLPYFRLDAIDAVEWSGPRS